MFADRPNSSAPGARRLLRAVPLALPLVALLGLSACGDGGGNAGAAPDVVIQPTVFVTQPSVTTSSTAAPLAEGEEAPDGTRSTVKQSYEIVSGDTPYGIASDFEIEYSDLVALNEWPNPPTGAQFFVGAVIDIPPDALDASVVERNRRGSSDDDDDASSEDEPEDVLNMDTEVEEDGEVCANGDPRPTYTIAAGDIPGRVATKLDITVEQLTEANSGSNIMNTFIVGQELLLPCPADED